MGIGGGAEVTAEEKATTVVVGVVVVVGIEGEATIDLGGTYLFFPA